MCLEKFGIQIVFAHSPETKGRVERAFKNTSGSPGARITKSLNIVKVPDLVNIKTHFQLLNINAPVFSRKSTPDRLNPLSFSSQAVRLLNSSL